MEKSKIIMLIILFALAVYLVKINYDYVNKPGVTADTGLTEARTENKNFLEKKNITPINVPEGYNIYSIITEGPPGYPRGSIRETIDLASHAGIDIIGFKMAGQEEIEAANNYSRDFKRGVLAVFSKEDSGSSFTYKNQTYYKSSYYIGPYAQYPISLQNLTWEDFKIKMIAKVHELGGLFYSSDIPLIEDSLKSTDGIDMLAIGYKGMELPTEDLEFFTDKIPTIVTHDVHAKPWNENWKLHYGQTLFIAREPTFEEFKIAVKKNWVVSVFGQEENYRYYGKPEVIEYVKQHIDKWKIPKEEEVGIFVVTEHTQSYFKNLDDTYWDWPWKEVIGAGIKIHGPDDRYWKLIDVLIDNRRYNAYYINTTNRDIEQPWYYLNYTDISLGNHTINITWKGTWAPNITKNTIKQFSYPVS